MYTIQIDEQQRQTLLSALGIAIVNDVLNAGQYVAMATDLSIQLLTQEATS